MRNVKLDAIELERRRPVWLAMSELFLDTQLDDCEYERIANVLYESQYSREQLRHILRDEVGSACVFNMLCVAGVWDGFDPVWLEAMILRRRLPGMRYLWGALAMRLIRPDWERVAALLDRLRKD